MQAIFITLDPERDTPELLKAYMGNFDPSFVALVPTVEALPALAKDFKIYYKKVAGTQPANYTLDHSAGTYIYDTEGHLRLYARYGHGCASADRRRQATA
jgi:protein SCO1